MNYSATISKDYKKLRTMIRIIINRKIQVLLIAEVELLSDFCKMLQFLLNNSFYILTPGHQMGDFWRQITP